MRSMVEGRREAPFFRRRLASLGPLHQPAAGPPPLQRQGRIRTGMRIALSQPDQAGNVGTILRLAACLGVAVDIIEPCGFPWSDRALRRAGMDYAAIVNVTRHESWAAFERQARGRLALLTTRGATPLPSALFAHDDILLLGSESSGVPDAVHERAELRIRIPQTPATRSLNIAVAAGIALGEALRQTGGWPE